MVRVLQRFPLDHIYVWMTAASAAGSPVHGPDISDSTLWKNIKCVMLILFFVHDTPVSSFRGGGRGRGGGLKAFYWHQIFALDSVVVKIWLRYESCIPKSKTNTEPPQTMGGILNNTSTTTEPLKKCRAA